MSVSMGMKMLDHPERWTLEEFLTWEGKQPERYELVDGQPRMMAGGTLAHSVIQSNITTILNLGLRDNPCRPHGDNLRIPIPKTGNVRMPDAAIDCGSFDQKSRTAIEPAVVVEVLSNSNRWQDVLQLLEDYDSVPSIQCYIMIEQDKCWVRVYERNESSRLTPTATYMSLEDRFVIPTFNIEVKLSELYDRITFETRETEEAQE
jgi:Uncharacterized protein conserved in cyanobacteria